MGIVPKEEISYNYFSNIEDVVKIGSLIDLVVLEVDLKKQKLTLGMKQLEQCFANDAQVSSDDEYEYEFEQEAVYDVRIKKIKYPGVIITDAFDKYSCGVILPNNILLDDTPISASARWVLVSGLYQEGEYIMGVQCVESSDDSSVAFLQVNLPGNMGDVPMGNIVVGEISEVEVNDVNNDYIQIETRDKRLAYINSSYDCITLNIPPISLSNVPPVAESNAPLR